MIVIVGGGPAGLALAWHLKELGLPCRVLERGQTGESWRLMPSDSRVLSPWWTNRLPGGSTVRHRAWRKISTAEYCRYLQRYTEEHNLPVESAVEITGVSRDTDGNYRLQHSRGELKTRLLVAATGQYQNPYWTPLPEGNDGSIRSVHAAQFNGAHSLPDLPVGSRILVVGRRITAGQIMVELQGSGHQVSLSAGGPVRTRAAWRRHFLKESLYFLYEPLLVWLFPGRRAFEHPIMDGGPTRHLLDRGLITVLPALRGVCNGEALFADGQHVRFDAIVHATGYRPALGWLASLLGKETPALEEIENFESRQFAGLFFLGLDNLHDFRSGFLRGIVADARRLAKVLRRRAEATASLADRNA